MIVSSGMRILLFYVTVLALTRSIQAFAKQQRKQRRGCQCSAWEQKTY